VCGDDTSSIKDSDDVKAEGPSGSSANSPREGKVKEIVFDESFIPLPLH